MKTRLFYSFMTLALVAFVFCACEKSSPDEIGSLETRAGSDIVWNGSSDKEVAVDIPEVKSLRTNASGIKIPSNAHSADFPGLYFIWSSKQKDNGYLKVAAWVFDKYESFVLTSKESNTYWDFVISLQYGQLKTADNCYVFFIPKVYNNKNINMVFLTEFVEKEEDPPVEITPSGELNDFTTNHFGPGGGGSTTYDL